MAQRLALLGRLLAKLPEGATPVLHGDMGWQYQQDDAVAHLNRVRTSKD